MARPWRLLSLWLVLVALGTMHPFVLDWRPVTVPSDTFFLPRFKGGDPPFNILMFMPLGALLRRLGMKQWSATLLGLGVSTGIELAQHYIAFRVPVLEDLFFNTLGTLIGARYHGFVGRAASWLERRAVRAALFVTTTAVVVWSAVPPVVEGQLWFWQDEALLIVGREQPGNYRFNGKVHAARLYDGAHDGAKLPDEPDWSLAHDGQGRADELARKIEKTGAFTIDVDLESDATIDPVLRRIFTWSFGVQRRNFMLAERNGTLVFRVRTRVTPIVGLFPDGEEPLEIPMPKGRRRVTVAYDTNVVRAWIDGTPVATKHFVLAPHNGARTFWLPRNALGVWLYMLSAGLVVAAGLVGLLRFSWALGAAVGLGLALELVQVGLFDRGIDVLALVPLVFGAWFGAWAAKR